MAHVRQTVESDLRGNFTSTDDLRAQVLACIDYVNRTMAKPFKCGPTSENRSMLDRTWSSFTYAGR